MYIFHMYKHTRQYTYILFGGLLRKCNKFCILYEYVYPQFTNSTDTAAAGIE